MRKKYRLRNFVFDVFATCVTGGFWVIWIFCREIRWLKK